MKASGFNPSRGSGCGLQRNKILADSGILDVAVQVGKQLGPGRRHLCPCSGRRCERRCAWIARYWDHATHNDFLMGRTERAAADAGWLQLRLPPDVPRHEAGLEQTFICEGAPPGPWRKPEAGDDAQGLAAR